MHIEFPPLKDIVVHDMDKVRLPRMVTVAQRYDTQCLEDLDGAVRRQMDAAIRDKSVYRGKSICVTAGSRGIPHMALLLRSICDVLRQWGAEPFVIPAMGSHGGGTAQGQLEILAAYGVTEQTVGAPVRASMEVVPYGRLSNGIELYCDKMAWEADGIVVFHKVKPHTDFRGEHESGLAKMIAIGLAKHKGASSFHDMGFEHFARYIPEAAEIFLSRCKLALGVGVIQNAYDDIAMVRAAKKEQIMELDAQMLAVARTKLPQFKFKDADILVIDQIGKNISGWGHDPNVTGRPCAISADFSDVFHYRFLVILSLTEQSHHNGCGLAAADMTTRRCLNSVEWGQSWTNIFNNRELQGGRIPMYANSDREALLLTVRALPGDRRDQPRIVRIKNTLEMGRIEVSEALYEQIRDTDGIEFLSGPHDWSFDSEGYLAQGAYA